MEAKTAVTCEEEHQLTNTTHMESSILVVDEHLDASIVAMTFEERLVILRRLCSSARRSSGALGFRMDQNPLAQGDLLLKNPPLGPD